MEKVVSSADEMHALGQMIASSLHGGDVVILTGDVGAGKTVLTKGIAVGLGVDEDVQSPTFTISRVYEAAGGMRLYHYDFYRLSDAGIMKEELKESVADPQAVTVIEWAGIVEEAIPKRAVRIAITPTSEEERQVLIEGMPQEGRD